MAIQTPNSASKKFGLIISMMGSLLCIVIIIFMWYTLTLPDSPLHTFATSFISTFSTDAGSSEQMAGEGSQNGINTAAQPRAADDSRDAINLEIAAQQKQYAHARQAAQRDQTFHPENRIPQFFKKFYGDLRILRSR